MVSIVIPVFNQLEYTQGCLDSIEAYTPEPHEIIFVDNGSTDGTHEWLVKYCNTHPDCTVIRNETNTGFPHACNQGIEFSKGEHILLLNNDVIVTEGWLSGLLEVFNKYPDCGITGPMTNNISGVQQVVDSTGYDSPLKMQVYAKNFRKAFKGRYLPFWRVVGFCILIRREVINAIGPLDETFTPGNFEDDDFCRRSVLAGYRNIIAADTFIHHFGSVSHQHLDHGKLLSENQAKFNEKWNDWLKGNNKISCCMIVKDEAAFIGDTVQKIMPYVDEVVVVDTGSKDRTKEIATQAGAKVHDFKWTGRFDDARNYANSKASHPWIFSLDADEELGEKDTDCLRKLLVPLSAFQFVTRNYTTELRWAGFENNAGEYPKHEVGIGWFPSTKVRLWPNDDRVRFCFPVHEVLEPSIYDLGLNVFKSGIPIHHYGKFDLDKDAEKGERYYNILTELVKGDPADLRSLEELATQAQNIGKIDQAIDLWGQYMKLAPNDFRSYYNQGHCYACKGDNEKALELSKKAHELNPDMKEPHMNTAVCEFRLGNLNRAIEICNELIEKHPDYPLAKGLLVECNNYLQAPTGG